MSLSDDTLSVLTLARTTQKWVVIVCPDDDSMMASRRTLSAGLGEGDKYSGRTAAVGGGGQISIVNAHDEPFSSEGPAFSVLFLGLWKTPGSEMERWRLAATEILTLST